MQYSVPQFIDVEDKIIGPLTLKQFLILLAGGLLIFFFWKIFQTGAGFFIALLPTLGVVIGFAFGKFNGRPILVNMADFLKFFFSPKRRVFLHQTEALPLFLKEEPASQRRASPLDGERVSRLKRLAYLLDQKTAEEERIIHSGKMGEAWINKI